MEEFAVWVARELHSPCVHLVGHHLLDAFCPGAVRLTHRNPYVGVEEIAPLYRLGHLVGYGDFCPRGLGHFLRHLQDLLVRPVAFGSGSTVVHAHFSSPHHQAVAHVVAGIAKVAECDVTKGLVTVLAHGEEICQYLGGMPFIRKAIPHRDTRVLSQGFHLGLLKAAVLYPVIDAPQHSGGVSHRFLLAHLRAARAEVGYAGPLVVRCGLERAAGAGAILFE